MSKQLCNACWLCFFIFAICMTMMPANAAEFKGEMRIAHVSDYSGPVAKTCSHIRDGLLDYARYVNEELGGVKGYKLVIEPFDTKYDVNILVQSYRRYVNEQKVQLLYSELAGSFGPAREMAAQKKFVMLSQTTPMEHLIQTVEDEAAGKENYIFSHMQLDVSRLASAMEMIKQDWAKKGKKGVPNVAAVGQDHQLGKMAAIAAKKYAPKYGLNYVGAIYFPFVVTDAVSQVATLQKWNADYLVGTSITEQVLNVLIKEFDRMNYKPMLVHHVTIGTVYLDTKNPLLEGHSFYQYTLDWPDVSNPTIRKIHELNKKWYPNVESRQIGYITGWHGGTITAEVLGRAVEQYGIDNMTGPNIRKTFESMKKFPAGDLSGPISYSAWDHQGSHTLRWATCQNGKVVPVTGFIEAPPLSKEEREMKYWVE